MPDPDAVPATVSVNVDRLSVPVPLLTVLPLTVLGVIAPRDSVIAGVVVGVATVPLTPFAVTTETVDTVPPVGGVPLAAAVIWPLAFTVRPVYV